MRVCANTPATGHPEPTSPSANELSLRLSNWSFCGGNATDLLRKLPKTLMLLPVYVSS